MGFAFDFEKDIRIYKVPGPQDIFQFVFIGIGNGPDELPATDP